MSFQDNLRQYRNKLGINAKDFAAEIGIPYTKYIAYENKGVEPKYDTLCRIAAALHVSIDDLLGYKVDRLEYWEAYLEDEGYRFIDNGNSVTVLWWDKEDYELAKQGKAINATMDVDFPKDKLINLLNSLEELAMNRTADTRKDIIKLYFFQNFHYAKIAAMKEYIENEPIPPIKQTTDIKKAPPIDGRD